MEPNKREQQLAEDHLSHTYGKILVNQVARLLAAYRHEILNSQGNAAAVDDAVLARAEEIFREHCVEEVYLGADEGWVGVQSGSLSNEVYEGETLVEAMKEMGTGEEVSG